MGRAQRNPSWASRLGKPLMGFAALYPSYGESTAMRVVRMSLA
jgi:hypothetical protein